MFKNSAAHQKKFEHSMRVLLKAPGISIPESMILAQFLKKDVVNKTVHWAVRQCQD
jgi:hypothetical protein